MVGGSGRRLIALSPTVYGRRRCGKRNRGYKHTHSTYQSRGVLDKDGGRLPAGLAEAVPAGGPVPGRARAQPKSSGAYDDARLGELWFRDKDPETKRQYV